MSDERSQGIGLSQYRSKVLIAPFYIVVTSSVAAAVVLVVLNLL